MNKNFLVQFCKNVISIITVSLILFVIIKIISSKQKIASSGHALNSLELALNRVLFKNQIIFKNNQFLNFIRNEKIALLNYKKYVNSQCPQSLYIPYTNNENFLSIVFETMIKIFPNINLYFLDKSLKIIQILFILFFGYSCLKAGISNIILILILLWALIINFILNTNFAMTVYPNLMPALLLAIALQNLIMTKGKKEINFFSLLLTFSLGLIYGCIFNLRTSYLPCLLYLVLIYFLYNLQKRKFNKNCFYSQIKIALFLFFGFILSNYFINKNNKDTNINYSHHAVWHPIVLGIAKPENEFAEKLGIRWEDKSGLNLAQQVFPKTKYLDNDYDKALKIFYFGLWEKFPYQMIKLYLAKIYSSGFLFIDIKNKTKPFKKVYFYTKKIWPNGWFILASLISILTYKVFYFKKTKNPRMLLLVLISGVCFLLLLESIIIWPSGPLVYNSFILFAYGFLFLNLFARQGFLQCVIQNQKNITDQIKKTIKLSQTH